MEPDEKALNAIRRMYAEYLADKNRKLREYRDAVLLENCVVCEPAKSPEEAARRNESRAEVDRFLWRCRIGLT